MCKVTNLRLWGLLSVAVLAPSSDALLLRKYSESRSGWRYPAHITKPLVPCPAEGYYPHPRDCRWFYRCHDATGSGVFWRYYFECDPMKIFVAGVNKCDYIHVVGDQESSCTDWDLKPPQNTSFPLTPPYDPTVDSSSPIIPPNIPTYDLDDLENTIDVDGLINFPVSDSADSSQCFIMIGQCEHRLVCSEGNHDHLQSRRVCKQAFYKCHKETTSQEFHLCIPGAIYNPEERYCMEDNIFCHKPSGDYIFPPAPPIQIFGPTTVPPETTTQTTAQTTTQTTTQTWSTLAPWRPSFPNWTTQPPYPPPTTTTPRPTTITTTTTTTTTARPTTTTTQTTTTTEEPSELVFLNMNQTVSVSCSPSEPRPFEPWMERHFCTNYPRCRRQGDDLLYLDTLTLCEEFVECRRRSDGRWSVSQMKCPLPWLYSFVKHGCQYPPASTELCPGPTPAR